MATDLGRKYTDAQIASIERQLKKEYAQALKEMQAKCNKTLSKFEKTDTSMRAKEKRGEITHKQYIDWRNRAILRNKQVQGMVQDLTERAVHADEVAADYINGRIPRVFAENTNFATYEIEKQARINTNFTLVSEDAVSGLVTGRTPIFPIAKVDIPKDKQWNEKKIRSAITQGVLQGEAIPKIADRLQRVTDMDRVSATRNARTLMGRAQNEGRLEGIKRAHDLGLPVKKIWIATLDHRTRDSHVDLDGEVQEYDALFSNGLECPCASGPPEEVYNCRCDVRPIYDWSKFNPSDLSLRNTSHMEEGSYQEWKDAHKKQEKANIISLGLSANGYTKEQQSEMLSLLTNADATTRAVWQKYQGNFNAIQPLDAGKSEDSAYYRPPTNTVHLTQSYVARGSDYENKYSVHFHEFGHNIDYISNNGNPSSLAYRNKDGLTFEEIITREWDKKFKNDDFKAQLALRELEGNLDISKGGMGGTSYLNFTLRNWRLDNGISRDDERYSTLMDTIRSLSDNDTVKMQDLVKNNIDIFAPSNYDSLYSRDLLKSQILDYCKGIRNDYDLKTRGDLSDIFERYTVKNAGLEYPLGLGHGKDYALRDGSLAKETFAEMYSAEVSNPESLALIKQELPESYAAYREILGGLA